MIIDHDATQKTGVMTLMDRGDEKAVEKTLALPIVKPVGVEQETSTHALPAVEKMTGKPSGAVDLHRSAARVQRAMNHLGVAVWYGEYTKEFWVMDHTGLHSFADVTSMYQGMGWQDL